jgi:hypothetical protein
MEVGDQGGGCGGQTSEVAVIETVDEGGVKSKERVEGQAR